MDKPFAAIEFSSKKFKLVIGYELDGKIYVIYTLAKPYGHINSAGTFSDKEPLYAAIRDVKNFQDASAKLKVTISEALLSLPPYGLEIFQSKHITTVLGEGNKIGSIDIKNIYALIRQERLPQNSELVDIVPELYILDKGRSFVNPPFTEVSSTLSVSAKVHSLPIRIAENYMDILRHEGMNVRRPIVAPFGVAELLSTYPNMPQDYILVDIGSNITTVSLIGANQLYASRFFEWGGDNITDRIVEAFNINESEAERIKITYGIEKRQYSFHVPVCIKDNGDGNPIKHYSEELNYVIKKELDTFQNQLNNAINEIFNLNDPNLKSVPMILIGGGSLLNGLVDYLEPKVPSEFVRVVTPTSLGARNPTFFNCLGMLYVNSKYPLTFDEGQTKVGQVTRESK